MSAPSSFTERHRARYPLLSRALVLTASSCDGCRTSGEEEEEEVLGVEVCDFDRGKGGKDFDSKKEIS